MFLQENTPIEFYGQYNLWVKREDQSCSMPPFSKTRGVYSHIRKLKRYTTIGVLDTLHSQAGLAVSRACKDLGKYCINYYPHYKKEEEGYVRPYQQWARDKFDAQLVKLNAGRSFILYNRAKKHLYGCFQNTYMMPNALKLDEMVEETAEEVRRTGYDQLKKFDYVIIAISSGTIAAGVVKGFKELGLNPVFIFHMGYSRGLSATIKKLGKELSEEITIAPDYKISTDPSIAYGNLRNFREYTKRIYVGGTEIRFVDEGYKYSDTAKPEEIETPPPWPCNEYYDLKAFYWWAKLLNPPKNKKTLLWNIG